MERIDLAHLPEPAGSPPDPKDLLARIEAIEARQRVEKVHDPGCSMRVPSELGGGVWAEGGAFVAGVSCDCWLVRNA